MKYKLSYLFKLIISLTKRDIDSRYKGSLFGLFWAIINPLFLLGIYTFVFGVIFKSRWEGISDSITSFSITLFIGLITYNIFSESVSKSPWLITSNQNFVKKILFPIEILSIVNLFSSLFTFSMSFLAWLVMSLIFDQKVSLEILLLPFLIIPISIFSLGCSWFVSALGVYLKDIGQIISMLIMILLFASPVFYPMSSIPSDYQFLMKLNPLAQGIQMVRDVCIYNTLPNLGQFIYSMILSLVCALLGLSFFKKVKKGFPDVI